MRRPLLSASAEPLPEALPEPEPDSAPETAPASASEPAPDSEPDSLFMPSLKADTVSQEQNEDDTDEQTGLVFGEEPQ